MQRIKPTNYYGWLERKNTNKPSVWNLPSEVPGRLKSQKQFIALIEAAAAFL